MGEVHRHGFVSRSFNRFSRVRGAEGRERERKGPEGQKSIPIQRLGDVMGQMTWGEPAGVERARAHEEQDL